MEFRGARDLLGISRGGRKLRSSLMKPPAGRPGASLAGQGCPTSDGCLGLSPLHHRSAGVAAPRKGCSLQLGGKSPVKGNLGAVLEMSSMAEGRLSA